MTRGVSVGLLRLLACAKSRSVKFLAIAVREVREILLAELLLFFALVVERLLILGMGLSLRVV